MLFTTGSDLGDMLIRIGLFVVVQALVYVILRKSSSIFSTSNNRSSSFRPARSVSIRRIMAALQDLPAGEPSPPPRNEKSPRVEEAREEQVVDKQD